MATPRVLATRFLVASGMALLVAAAPGKPHPKEAADMMTPKLEELVFAKMEGERFKALHDWMEKRGAGWRHAPLSMGGNFVKERWCPPSVPQEQCLSGSVVTRESRGTAWMSLETLHYPQEWPKVFGLLVSIAHYPEKGELGLRFHLAEDGRTVVGSGMEATFLVMGPEKIGEGVSIGARMGLKIVETDVSVEAPGGWRSLLEKMAASPESLKTAGLSLLDALEKRAEQALAKGEVQGFDEGKYKGGGVPPMKTYRPLKPEELERESKAVHEEIARRKALIEGHHAAMHQLLRAHVPLALL